ncbi:MAG TPA: oxidoreductase [Sphingomonas sp.]|nr:oxidoreductase [Sphingomonas sp.]
MHPSSSKPVALITGAATGIGAATATALVQAGYDVVGTCRKDDSPAPPGVTMVLCDVTDDASVQSAVDFVRTRAGRIDLLVNNAGVGLAGAAEETSIEQSRRVFEVNFFGMVRMTHAVLPIMREALSGRILNISSVFGLMPAPYMAIYAATKHAVEGYTESLDHEIRPFGIRAIAIEPANTRTSFDTNLLYADTPLRCYDGTRTQIEEMVAGMARSGDDPAVVAGTIVAAATARSPALRYAAGRGRTLSLLRRFAPRRRFDTSLRKQLGINSE